MRLTLAGAMALTVLAALMFAALKAPTVEKLIAAEAATAAALLAALVLSRESRGLLASFAFGFAVFGLAYFAALTPWQWGLSRATTLVVRINPGLPTADLVTELTKRLAGPTPGGVGPVYDSWADRYQLTDGLLHLAVAWILSALGGGFALWARRVRRGGRRGPLTSATGGGHPA